MILDIDKSMPDAGPVYIRSGESGVAMSAEIVDQGVPADLTGMTATFRAMWRGGHGEAACTVDDSEVSWTMPAVPVPGRLLAAYVELSGGGSVITTQEIEMHAEEAAEWKCSTPSSI